LSIFGTRCRGGSTQVCCTAAHQNPLHTNGGANTSVTFDYGHFAACYDAVVDDLGLFDAMIEVRSNTKRVRIIYDTPCIRSLPTRQTFDRSRGVSPRPDADGGGHRAHEGDRQPLRLPPTSRNGDR
jgi:hypothetical protein